MDVQNTKRKKSSKFHQFDAEGEVSIEKNTKLLDLPKEVWYSILSWIPQIDKARSRLICKEWKQNVDLHATFQIKLHQNIPPDFLQRMLQLRINTIEFSSLRNDLDLTFAFPLLVKEIIISTNVYPNNFRRICEVFTQVQSLRFLSTYFSDKTFDSRERESSIEMLRNLKQLKTIEIGIVTFGPRQIWECETFNVICCSALELPFASLNCLTINLQLYHAEMFKFFEFLVKQKSTLDHLSIRMECPRITEQFSFGENFMDSTFPELKSLCFKSLHVMRDQGSCQFCDDQLEQIWREIIQNQESLSSLTVDLNKDFSIDEFVTLVRKNSTLRSLKIFGIHCAEGDEIPDDIFDESKLVELLLEFSGNTYFIISADGAISELQFEFSVIDKLPYTLKKFTLKKCSLPWTPLLAGLARLRNLEELYLEDCLFRKGCIDLKFFMNLFKTFKSAESNVQRFVFDGFKFSSEMDTRIPLWNDMAKIAVELNMLEISGRCFSLPIHDDSLWRFPGSVDMYDFRFDKYQVQEFVKRVDDKCICPDNSENCGDKNSASQDEQQQI